MLARVCSFIVLSWFLDALSLVHPFPFFLSFSSSSFPYLSTLPLPHLSLPPVQFFSLFLTTEPSPFTLAGNSLQTHRDDTPNPLST